MTRNEQLWGKLVCWWRGKHVERRVVQEREVSENWIEVRSYNRICTRCGRTRLAASRKRNAE